MSTRQIKAGVIIMRTYHNNKMHIAEIWRYPVKSLAGEQIDRTELSPDGIKGDRRILVYGYFTHSP
jgi:hypothetical protein